jgi:putative lipoic acid-binding regulatory protein
MGADPRHGAVMAGVRAPGEAAEAAASPFVFPCAFSIKAMGLAAPDFDALVVEIVRRHVGELGEGAVQVRPSSGGKYHAVTVRFEAESRAQLDALYRELSGHPRVLMSL